MAKPVQHKLRYPRRPGRSRKDPFDRRGRHVRPELDPRVALLVTQKLREGLPSARTKRHLLAFLDVLLRKQDPERLRVIEFTLQRDHHHLIVEAPGGREGYSRAMRSFQRALTSAWNREWEREGGLFASYDEVPITTARQAANATAYVLFNGVKHGVCGAGPDPASSALWSNAWSYPMSGPPPSLPPTCAPRTMALLESHRRFPLAPTTMPPTLTRAIPA